MNPFQRFRLDLSRQKAAWLILVTGFVITFATVAFMEFDHRRSDRIRLEGEIHGIGQLLQKRLDTSGMILRNAARLFENGRSPTRDEFRFAVAAMQISNEVRGIQGVGWAEWMGSADAPAYERRLRSLGYGEKSIRPPPDGRPIVTSITFLEPRNDRNERALGFDMYSEPVRREAMDRALLSGDLALSGRVTLVQESNQAVQGGTLLYLPIYGGGEFPASPEARKAALRGFVYSPFRMDDYVHAAVESVSDWMDLEIYDGTEEIPGRRFFDSLPGHEGPGMKTSRELRFAGRSWLLVGRVNERFLRSLDRDLPILSLQTFGFAFAFLLFFFARRIERGRIKAEEEAMRMLARLQFENRNHELNIVRARASLQRLNASVLPRIPGWHFEGLWIPFEEVGGDMVLVSPVRNRRLTLVIADCTGHGVEAALSAAHLHGVMRDRWDFLDEGDPAGFLESVNHALLENLEPGTYPTAFAGVLEIDTGRFSYANAQSPAPVLWSPKDGRRFLPSVKGLHLGWEESAVFETGVVEIAPGERLFLHSDALNEGRPDLVYGAEDLARRHFGAAAPLDVIRDSLETVRFPDDLTVVLLERKPAFLRGCAIESAEDWARESEVLRHELRERGWTEDETERFRIAVLEMVQNGLDHAGVLPVTVTLHVDTDVTRAVVEDLGPGFDPATVPDPTDPARLVSLFEADAPSLSRGRGIWLARRLAELRYENGGRRVVVERRSDPLVLTVLEGATSR